VQWDSLQDCLTTFERAASVDVDFSDHGKLGTGGLRGGSSMWQLFLAFKF